MIINAFRAETLSYLSFIVNPEQATLLINKLDKNTILVMCYLSESRKINSI